MPVQTRSQRQQSTLDADILTLLPKHHTNHHIVMDMFREHSFLKCLPQALQCLYMSVNKPTEATALINPKWILMPLEEVIQRYIQKQDKNQYCQNIDFATLYDGMGYYVVCCYCIRTKKFYYRHDGGGNLYEVEYNHNFATRNFTPSENQSFELVHWIRDVKQGRCVQSLNIVYAP